LAIFGNLYKGKITKVLKMNKNKVQTSLQETTLPTGRVDYSKESLTLPVGKG